MLDLCIALILIAIARYLGAGWVMVIGMLIATDLCWFVDFMVERSKDDNRKN